jgi:septal ring factor EnvC (AmiA/AmiB activator)
MFNFKIYSFTSRPRGFRFRSLITSTALAAIVAGGIFTMSARAQDVPSQDSQARPTGPSGEEYRGHHRMPSVDQQLKHLTKALKLSDDQQAKVRSALEDQRKQMEQIHNDASLSQNDRFSKMKEIHENTNTQIKSALSDDQQKKFDEIQQKHQEHMRGHQGPPPPQS